MATKTEKPKTLVIDRKTWLRGVGGDQSYLRNSSGKQCCLGFYARSCGLLVKDITGLRTPAGFAEVCSNRNKSIPTGVAWLIENYMYNSSLAQQLMTINDSESMSDETRERELKRIFATQGVKVQFVN